MTYNELLKSDASLDEKAHAINQLIKHVLDKGFTRDVDREMDAKLWLTSVIPESLREEINVKR